MRRDLGIEQIWPDNLMKFKQIWFHVAKATSLSVQLCVLNVHPKLGLPWLKSRLLLLSSPTWNWLPPLLRAKLISGISIAYRVVRYVWSMMSKWHIVKIVRSKHNEILTKIGGNLEIFGIRIENAMCIIGLLVWGWTPLLAYSRCLNHAHQSGLKSWGRGSGLEKWLVVGPCSTDGSTYVRTTWLRVGLSSPEFGFNYAWIVLILKSD